MPDSLVILQAIFSRRFLLANSRGYMKYDFVKNRGENSYINVSVLKIEILISRWKSP